MKLSMFTVRIAVMNMIMLEEAEEMMYINEILYLSKWANFGPF